MGGTSIVLALGLAATDGKEAFEEAHFVIIVEIVKRVSCST